MSVETLRWPRRASHSLTITGSAWRKARISARSCSFVPNQESSASESCLSTSPSHSAIKPSSVRGMVSCSKKTAPAAPRSEEHTSELQSHSDLVCRLLLEKKKKTRSNEIKRCDQ